jgi:hypothetical protein
MSIVSDNPASGLDGIMSALRAKTRARAEAIEAELEPLVDDIGLALADEQRELADAQRLRQLAKLRESAAGQHAVRVGRALEPSPTTVAQGSLAQLGR